MRLEKYHGLGNTFLITEFEKGLNYSKLSKEYCNNKTSIGSDGLIIIKKDPLEMLIFNKDGSEAIMCGNGLRCFLHYCFSHGLLKDKLKNIEVRTKSGIYVSNIEKIEPFISSVFFKRTLIRREEIGIFDELFDSYFVKVGVNHNVIVCTQETKEKIKELKENLLKYETFFDETNIDIVEKIDDNTISVLTYERGVGFTSSCGTGAVAAALVSNYLFDCSNNIQVVNEYGNLNIDIEGNKVKMTGPSIKVCDLEITND